MFVLAIIIIIVLVFWPFAKKEVDKTIVELHEIADATDTEPIQVLNPWVSSLIITVISVVAAFGIVAILFGVIN